MLRHVLDDSVPAPDISRWTTTWYWGDMVMTWKTRAHWAVVLLLAGGLPACIAAAVAGAGTGIYLTSRGAKSIVNGSVADVAARSTTVLEAEGVAIDATSTKQSGDQQQIKGKGDLDITVSIDRESPTTTNTEVTARKNLAEWDKDYAQHLLNEIVQKGAS